MEKKLLQQMLFINIFSVFIWIICAVWLALSLITLHAEPVDYYLQMISNTTDLAEVRFIVKGQTQVLINSFSAARTLALVSLCVFAIQIPLGIITRKLLKSYSRLAGK